MTFIHVFNDFLKKQLNFKTLSKLNKIKIIEVFINLLGID